MRLVITSTTIIKNRAGVRGKLLGEIRKLDTNAGVGIDLDCENITTGSGGFYADGIGFGNCGRGWVKG